MDFLGFSAEAMSPEGRLLMDLTNPVQKMFNQRFKDKIYCADIDEIFVVFVCFPEEECFYKERKYVSHKNRYADMRLYIDYDEFLKAYIPERIKMIYLIIERAVGIIAERVPSLKKDELLKDIMLCIDEVHK